MASVASSAASQTSCVFDGEVMNVDLALDKTVRSAQQGLTDLQVALRELCALDDQAIDELEDWKIAVSLYDKVEDWVEGVTALLEELVPIAAEIRGPAPDKETKAAYKLHVAARKAAKKKAADEKKVKTSEARKELAAMKLGTISEESKR
jgi:hypothetical protein